MADDSPVVLLRWNGQEKYYTGFGSYAQDLPEIEESLVARFADQNLGQVCTLAALDARPGVRSDR